MMANLRHLFAGAILLVGCSATPPTAPDANPIDPGTPPPAGTPAQGRFAGADGHRGVGAVSLTLVDGQALLEFGTDFGVSGVRGPFVYVNTTNERQHRNAAPRGRLAAE